MLDHFIEFFFGLGLFINAMLYIPQIIRLIQKKNSEEISLITFLGFNIINLFIVLHGVIKNDWLLFLGYGLTLLTNTVVTILIVWYRFFKQTHQPPNA